MEHTVGDVAPAPAPGYAPHDRAAGSSARNRIVDLLANEIFVLLVLACDALILSARPAISVRSDTWLALVGGRIVWNGWLPHHDALTVWAHGRTWIDEQWLGQLAFFGVHSLGGMRLLLLVHIALLVGGFGLALLFARRSGGSSRSVAAVGFLGLFVALPNSVARTQSIAYVLFISLFWLLAADVRHRSRRVLLVLPLLVLWANVHGSVVLGVLLVLLWGVDAVVRAGRRRDAAAWRSRGRAAAMAGAAVLCLLATPYGLDVVGYYRDVLGSSAFRELVGEWRPSTFPSQAPFFVFALGSIWLAARKPRALTLFEHLALLAMFFAGVDAVRNIVWFALVSVMVVPRALDAVWPLREAPLRRSLNVAVSLAALGVMLVAVVSAAARPAGSYARGYPPAATAAIASVARSHPSARIFANETFADWLLWEKPALAGRVAFDARFELLTDSQLRALADERRRPPHWRAPTAGYRILVLDPHVEKRVVRAVVAAGARTLYRDHDVVVLDRGGRA